MKILAFILSFFSFVTVCSQTSKAFEVTVVGKGEPVLLFPGFGCTQEVWEDTVAEISKTHECHLFTFAGFGDTAPIDMPWLSTIKDDIITYVTQKKLVKPTLLGHSLGGTLSYWLASEKPDMFKKVIAVDALPGTAALMIPNYNGDTILYDNPQSNFMLQMSDAEFNNMNAQQIQFMCKNPEKQKVLEAMMKKTDRKTYVYGYIDMLNLDLRTAIANITIPVTVLAATFPDKATVKKTYAEQFAKLPGVLIKYADNAAHFVMYDSPEWFVKNVIESLK